MERKQAQNTEILLTRPNKCDALSVTHPIPNKSALLSFATDNFVEIFDRRSFQRRSICTPDPTSKIVALTFVGSHLLFCCNDKRELFKYELSTYGDELKGHWTLPCLPTSMTCDQSMIFFLSNHSLYQTDIYEKSQHSFKLLTDTQSHQRCAMSPCGRALVSYTPYEKSPIIWFAPFSERKRFALPIQVPIIEFQWGCSEYLSAVTASVDGCIRYWIESTSSQELRCIHWFHFDSDILYLSIAHPLSDNFDFSEPRCSVSKLLPNIPTPEFLILAGTSEKCSVLVGDKLPQLLEITQIPIKMEKSTVISDFKHILAHGSITTLIRMTSLGRNQLTTNQLEIDSNNYLSFCPYKELFLSNVITDFTLGEHSFITRIGNTAFDWSTEQQIPITDDLFPPVNNRIPDVGFKPTDSISNGAYFVVYNSDNIRCFQNNSSNTEIAIQCISDPIKSVALHSSVLMAIATTSKIFIFTRESNEFTVAYSCDIPNALVTFVEHSFPLLIVSANASLSTYVVTSTQMKLIECLHNQPVNKLKIMNSSILATTKHSLIQFKNIEHFFPAPKPLDSDFVFFTALSVAQFAVVGQRILGKIPDYPTFSVRVDPESIQLRSANHLNPLFTNFCHKLPAAWHRLDINGLRFLFSFLLTVVYKPLRQYLPLFSIWALLSKNQVELAKSLSFPSIYILLQSFLPLWASDTQTLTVVVMNYLTHTVPKQKEVEEYLLLCVVVNKLQIAAQVATMHNLPKLGYILADTASIKKQKTRILKSAYSAMSSHRNSLAALFFLLVDEKQQAIRVLKEIPLLMLLVSRLLGSDSWHKDMDKIELNVLEGFYQYWHKNDIDGAARVLSSLELPNSIISLELHRILLLQRLNHLTLAKLLDLYEIPYFTEFVIKDQNIVHSQSFQDIVEEPAVLEVDTPAFTPFDFGMKDWTLQNIDDDDEFEEEEKDEEEEKVKSEKTLNRTASVLELFQVKEEYLELVQSLRKESFVPKPVSVWSLSESSVTRKLIALINQSYTPEDVQFLYKVSRHYITDHEMAPFVFSIIFIYAFATAAFNILSPIFETQFDPRSISVIFEQSFSIDYHQPSDQIDFLAKLSTTEYTQNDVKLMNFLIFHRFTVKLEEKLIGSRFINLIGFLHATHRYLQDQLETFEFSSEDVFIDSTPAIGGPSKVQELLLKLANHHITEEFQIAVTEYTKSPFIADNKFIETRSYITMTGLKSVEGICINPRNNQNVACVNRGIAEFFASQEEFGDLETNSFDDGNDGWEVLSMQTKAVESFESPMRQCLHTTRIPERHRFNHSFEFKRVFNSVTTNRKEIKARAICSHPTDELFVTGDNTGHISIWEFGHETSKRSIKILDQPFAQVKFNARGNRLIGLSKDGVLINTDFQKNEGMPLGGKCRFDWFNLDSQVVVRKQQALEFYDLLAGRDPVVTIPVASNAVAPVAVSKYFVATGDNTGEILLYDTRFVSMIASVRSHEKDVTAIEFDKSGRFCASGSSDNTVSILGTDMWTPLVSFENVLPNDDHNIKFKGVSSLALSNQVIVASGSSPFARIWVVSGPQHDI